MTNTATTAQSVTIYGPNLPRSISARGDMVVHRTGCADTRKGAYRNADTAGRLDARSIEDIVDDVYGGFGEYEGYRGGIYVFPCVDLPEHVEG